MNIRAFRDVLGLNGIVRTACYENKFVRASRKFNCDTSRGRGGGGQTIFFT